MTIERQLALLCPRAYLVGNVDILESHRSPTHEEYSAREYQYDTLGKKSDNRWSALSVVSAPSATP